MRNSATPSDPASRRPVGFVAAEDSLCDELTVSTEHCGVTGSTLVVSSADAVAQVAAIRADNPQLSLMCDCRIWARRYATADVPTSLHEDMTLFTPDLRDWSDQTRAASGADFVLAPTFCVRLGDRDALRAVLDATADSESIVGLVTFIAIDARTLTSRYVGDFIEDMRSTPSRRFAFLFADYQYPLQKYDRIQGLRRVLEALPGSWIVGVDALIASDALAHGAGWVAVGASSGRRWPHRPGDKGGGPNAEGFRPGTFNRPLLAFRSPAFYESWYANSRSPRCEVCEVDLDAFEATPADKARIVRHNLHEITDLCLEVVFQPADRRADWLNEVRLDAFARHRELSSVAKKVAADPTLIALVELDDPQMRKASLDGSWQ